MTSPLGNAGQGSPPTISVGTDSMPFILPTILQALQNSRAMKLRKAENALGLVEQGATFGELTPESQKQVEKATGRKYQPDEVVAALPLSQDEASVNRLIQELGLPETSTLAVGLKGALAGRIATGSPTPLSTPEQLSVAQETAAASGRAQRSEALAKESQAKSYETAVGKLKAGQTEFTPEDVNAFQLFNQFVPSQAVADQLSGTARAKVMEHAIRLASDPDSGRLARVLAPLGITPSDAIGAFALGIGSTIETAINRKAQIDIAKVESAGKASELALKSLLEASTEISKRMGGAYSPSFIASVMEGDKKAIGTDAGKLVQRFTSSGYHTAITELALKGSPQMQAMNSLLEIARVPQIGSDNKLLGQYSNLVQEALASTLTELYMGSSRPLEAGDEQKVWDAYQQAMRKRTAGVFGREYFMGLIPHGLQVSPSGPAADATAQSRLPEAQKRQVTDQAIFLESMKAIFGDSSVVQPAAPTGPAALGPQIDTTRKR